MSSSIGVPATPHLSVDRNCLSFEEISMVFIVMVDRIFEFVETSMKYFQIEKFISRNMDFGVLEFNNLSIIKR